MSENTYPTPLKRRNFLTTMLSGGIGVAGSSLFQGCRSCQTQTLVHQQPHGVAPFWVWEDILKALKTSPDHLSGRKENLIEQGDPKAMFDFVRDAFFLVPADGHRIGAIGTAVKAGLAQVLRSGMATPREKADLLNEMFQKSGLTSKVVYERTEVTTEEAQAFFHRPIERKFHPEIADSQLDSWMKGMGVDSSGASEPTFVNLTDAEKLGKNLWDVLNFSPDQRVPSFDFRWPRTECPTVEFVWKGETLYAHLFDPKVPFGKLRSGDPKNVGQAEEAKRLSEELTIELTYRDSIATAEEKTLIKASWPASELIGRQIGISFEHDLTLDEQALTSAATVRTFSPMLFLQAMDKDAAFMAEHSVLSDSVMLSGKRISQTEDGQVMIGDSPLLAKSDPDLQKKVVTLNAIAKSTSYPEVRVDVTALDAQGKPVEGLSGSDFQLLENGEPVSAILESNQRTPRVLLLADSSGSMPSEFRRGEMDAFVDKLKASILEKYPAAVITLWKTSSALFTWLERASGTDNDLIVFTTDGDNTDHFDPAKEPIYRNGPPAIVLDVRPRRENKTFQTMADLTGGVVVSATDHQTAVTEIGNFLSHIEVPPYVLTYFSLSEGDEQQVEVSIDEKRLKASTSYQTGSPETRSASFGQRIIGLYLKVSFGKKETKRVLAGWDPEVLPRALPSQEMADEVHDMMFGRMMLSVESGGPSFSAALSDLLTARLSHRKWGEALLKDDLEKAKEEFEELTFSYSTEFIDLMAPLANPATDQSLTFATGIRVGMQTMVPGFITGRSVSRFDYLPLSDFRTIAADPREAFRVTMEKTAQLALRESAAYPVSAYSQLDGVKLIEKFAARTQKLIQNLPSEEKPYWAARVDSGSDFRIFAEDLSVKAFWALSPHGELYGILPDATGGGRRDHESDLKKRERLMAALSRLDRVMSVDYAKLASYSGRKFKPHAHFGVTLVRLYAVASETLIIMEPGFRDKAVAQTLQTFACGLHRAIYHATGAGNKPTMPGLNKLITSLYDGSGDFNC